MPIRRERPRKGRNSNKESYKMTTSEWTPFAFSYMESFKDFSSQLPETLSWKLSTEMLYFKLMHLF